MSTLSRAVHEAALMATLPGLRPTKFRRADTGRIELLLLLRPNHGVLSRQRSTFSAAAASCALLALVGCANEQEKPKSSPPEVVVAMPLQREIVDWDDFVGRFEASKMVEVRSRVAGYLQSLHFKDGDTVAKGQLLFLVDPRPFEAALDEAKAQLTRAEADVALARTRFDRGRVLLASETISREELDTREATLATTSAAAKAVQATVRSRTLDLSFTRVVAPIAGRVSNRRVDVGNLVSGGDAAGATLLTTVVALDPIYFSFHASEALYLKYAREDEAERRASSRTKANPVEIRLLDEPTYRWRGKMDFVDNVIERGSGTIAGRALVDNPKGFLTPGMFGRMRLLGSGAYKALLIPDGAVQTDQTLKTVLVVDAQGVARSKAVELGPLIDGLRVARGGLEADDRVVIGGLQRARVGEPVAPRAGTISPPAAGTSPTQAAYRLPPSSEATNASTKQ